MRESGLPVRDYEHEKWVPWYVADTATWLELSLAARGAMAEIVRKLNGDGKITLRRGLSSLASLLRLRWEGELEPAIAELIAAGKVVWDGSLFTLSDPGFESRKRRTSADRMRDLRARRKEHCDGGDVTVVTPVTVTPVTPVLVCSSLVSSGSDLPEGESAREGTAKPSTLRYRTAYAEGIAKGKGSPYAWPPGSRAEWADKDLGHAIAVFAKSKSTGQAVRGDMLLGWIAAAAEDFVEHVLEAKDDPKFWSNFDPKGLVRFLNQDVQAKEARRVG